MPPWPSSSRISSCGKTRAISSSGSAARSARAASPRARLRIRRLRRAPEREQAARAGLVAAPSGAPQRAQVWSSSDASGRARRHKPRVSAPCDAPVRRISAADPRRFRGRGASNRSASSRSMSAWSETVVGDLQPHQLAVALAQAVRGRCARRRRSARARRRSRPAAARSLGRQVRPEPREQRRSARARPFDSSAARARARSSRAHWRSNRPLGESSRPRPRARSGSRPGRRRSRAARRSPPRLRARSRPSFGEEVRQRPRQERAEPAARAIGWRDRSCFSIRRAKKPCTTSCAASCASPRRRANAYSGYQ